MAILVAVCLSALATGLIGILFGTLTASLARRRKALPREPQTAGKATLKLFGVQLNLQVPGLLGGLGLVFVLVLTFVLTFYAVLRVVPGKP